MPSPAAVISEEKRRCRSNTSPLLAEQRGLHDLAPGPARFEHYLARILTLDRNELRVVPLAHINPMAKDHVRILLDDLLAFDAEAIARDALAESGLGDSFGEIQASLVVIDDLMGGWTNRAACEYQARFEVDPSGKRFWLTGRLWSSEPASAEVVRRAMSEAVYRAERVMRVGLPNTLGEAINQEGEIMARAGHPGVGFEAWELVGNMLGPHLGDALDLRTATEFLFGDPHAESLGFERRGVPEWGGLGFALANASIGAIS